MIRLDKLGQRKDSSSSNLSVCKWDKGLYAEELSACIETKMHDCVVV